MVLRRWSVFVSCAILGLASWSQAEEPYERSPRRLAVSADGTRIAVASEDQRIRIWESESGQEIFSLKVDLPAISVAFSNDGKKVVAGTVGIRPDAQTPSMSHLYAWDISAESPRLLWKVPKKGWGQAMAIDPTDSWCAIASLYAILDVVDLRTGELRGRLIESGSNGLIDVAVTRDSKSIVTCGQNYRIWKMNSDMLLQSDTSSRTDDELEKSSSRWIRSNVSDCASTTVISRDGRWAIAIGTFYGSGGANVNLAKIDIANGELSKLLIREIAEVTSLALSPDEKTLAIGLLSDEVKLWSMEDNALTATWKIDGLNGLRCLAYLDQGRQLAVAGRNGERVVVLNAANGKTVRTLSPNP